MSDLPRDASMEKQARIIGDTIGRALETQFAPGEVGYCLLLFTFGDEGWSTYISNAEPEDMIAALRELADERERRLKETGR